MHTGTFPMAVAALLTKAWLHQFYQEWPSQCVYVQKQPKITFQFQFEQKLFEKTMVRIFVLVLKLLEAISEEPCFS